MNRLYFNPIPKLTIYAALALALLLGLGVWQIQRLHWKLNLIRTVHDNMTGPALTLDEALAMGMDRAEYHRVRLRGHFDNAHEAYVYTVTETGPVYHVLTPFIVDGEGGKAVIVDRGKIPQSLKNPATRADGELSGERSITGIWRRSYSPGWFTPPPDLGKHEWFVRDAVAIAAADHAALVAPAVLEADATPNPGGWPQGGQTIVHFRNEHLQYAITWFSLAFGLVVIYLVYHKNQGRLGWRR